MLLCSFNGRVVLVKKVFGLGRDHDSCAFAGFCCCFVRRVKPMVTSTSHPPISHNFCFLIKVEKSMNNDKDILETIKPNRLQRRGRNRFSFSVSFLISTKHFGFLYDFIRFPHHCWGYFCPLFFTICSVY